MTVVRSRFSGAYFALGAFVGFMIGLLVSVAWLEQNLATALVVGAGCALLFGVLGAFLKEAVLEFLEMLRL